MYNILQAFSQFGPVERAIHVCDDKGRPSGEGFVEFERKSSAAEALKRINDGCFMLTAYIALRSLSSRTLCSTPHPIQVEPLEQRDEEDGLRETHIQNTPIKLR